jgi:hypothetical protein
MAGAGTITFRRRSVVTRAVAGAAALAVVASLLAWNASQEVAPSLQISDARARAVDAIVADVPREAHVLVSLMLRGRLADLGYRAQGGFEALQNTAARGGRGNEALIAPLLSESRRSPVFVSRNAFGWTLNQSRFLGATGDAVWRLLHVFWRFKPVLTVRGLPFSETLYRVRLRVR